MTRGTRRWLLILLAMGIVVAIVLRWRATDDMAVAIYRVAKGPVSATASNTRAGTVKACRRAALAPNAAGQVIQLNVREGSRVEEGDLLLELWHADLDAQLAQTRHESAVAMARATETCTRADFARRDATRIENLRKQQFVSQEQLDRARTEASAGKSACEAARRTAQATQARIAVISANIEKTRLLAPFSGVVAEVNAELGEFITPSPTGIQTLPAVDLIDDSCIYVSAPIDEVDAPDIALGMPARITLDAFRGQTFSGRVRRIAPYVLEREKQARTVEVEATFDDDTATGHLLVGYSADLEVTLQERPDVVRIPTESLLDEDRVLVWGPDHRLTERKVSTGIANWQYVEIIAGLKAGEKIARFPGQEGIKAGIRVREKAPD